METTTSPSLGEFAPSLTPMIEVPKSDRLAMEQPSIVREEVGLGRSWVEREHAVSYPQLPEPASLLLLFTGVAGLFARRHLHRERGRARQ